MKKILLLFLGLLLFSTGDLFAQGKVTVSGSVVDSKTKEPMSGATVIAKDGTYALVTSDGTYSINVSPGDVLTYTFVNYKNAQFTVPTGQESVTHDVRLESKVAEIDELVVVAYGTRKKGTVSGSVSTVKSEKIADVPTAGFDKALQGQVAGLSVISSSGDPSAASFIKIRGTNSINAGTAPLYILDGVPLSVSDFNMLSPSDIESVTVLKDASSTSIYGARASNGVLVITTKQGRMNKAAQITYRGQVGVSQMALGKWNMMNTAERIAYEREVGEGNEEDHIRNLKTDVNWVNEVFRNNALLHSHDVQVTAGSDKATFFASGGYYDQQGVAVDSYFKRYTMRTNVSYRAKEWLRIGTNSMLGFEKFSRSVSGDYYTMAPISAAQLMMPYWNPYRADGSLASINDGSWKGQGQNPLEWSANNPYYTKKTKLISTVFTDINIIEGLVFRTNFGIDYMSNLTFDKSTPSYLPNGGFGRAGRGASNSLNLSITNTLTYSFNKGNDHNFILMAGQEGGSYLGEGFSVSTKGQTNDLLTILSAGTSATNWPDIYSEYSLVSYFARGEYNYKQRYFFDLSGRIDGSSRFGKDNRYGVFGSLGFMWNVHREDFFKKNGWINTLQISASTGTAGNSAIPDYAHIALVAGGVQYDGNGGIIPISKGNEKLTWEKTWTTNFAVKTSFLNRYTAEVELYNKKTTNMLMSVPESYTDGDGGYHWDNVGTMVNRGVEFNINADIISNKSFRWNVNANASYNYNKITELFDGKKEFPQGTTGQTLVVGHSYGEFYLNRFAGVNSANGEQMWYDKDGNLTTECLESDKVLVGKSSIAPWTGGFGTTLSWKNFTLTAQASWVWNRWMMNNDRYFSENSNITNSNLSKRMLYDRWKNPGDITDIPRYGSTPQFDTHLLEDASYLRLKNVMLSYNINKTPWMKKLTLNNIRVFVQGQNLWTLTKFSGLDPENVSNIYKAQYPMSKQYTFGAEITF